MRLRDTVVGMGYMDMVLSSSPVVQPSHGPHKRPAQELLSQENRLKFNKCKNSTAIQ